jgi:hypothetical protein
MVLLLVVLLVGVSVLVELLLGRSFLIGYQIEWEDPAQHGMETMCHQELMPCQIRTDIDLCQEIGRMQIQYGLRLHVRQQDCHIGYQVWVWGVARRLEVLLMAMIVSAKTNQKSK